ncbi:hypothetical protein JK628_15980 [Shewanella sp. KX20019]|uniref:hypothetical protein n=1 Tax=Shewanella sp. KX20019 TaxID=2803864 RepID=UPI0019288A3F|nr:hypothetical protein [Shewanella sp. KX20019]QQX79050.1 hypothetical protein JK628_15980 [Shewanella sp. KX20019]
MEDKWVIAITCLGLVATGFILNAGLELNLTTISNLLGILASISALFGLRLAYKVYNMWRKPITHSQIEKLMEAINERKVFVDDFAHQLFNVCDKDNWDSQKYLYILLPTKNDDFKLVARIDNILRQFSGRDCDLSEITALWEECNELAMPELRVNQKITKEESYEMAEKYLCDLFDSIKLLTEINTKLADIIRELR